MNKRFGITCDHDAAHAAGCRWQTESRVHMSNAFIIIDFHPLLFWGVSTVFLQPVLLFRFPSQDKGFALCYRNLKGLKQTPYASVNYSVPTSRTSVSNTVQAALQLQQSVNSLSLRASTNGLR